jgi:hypothetical protein
MLTYNPQCRSKTPTGNFKDKEGKDCATQNGGTLVLGSHGDVYAPGGQGVFWDPEQDVSLTATFSCKLDSTPANMSRPSSSTTTTSSAV